MEQRVRRIGDVILRVVLGLLFIWGGLEKLDFSASWVGGVGVETMAQSLGRLGFGFLGQTGLYYLALWLAVTELISGILILINYKSFYASLYAGFVLVVALVTIYLPQGNWMQSMIHIALIGAYVANGLQNFHAGDLFFCKCKKEKQ